MKINCIDFIYSKKQWLKTLHPPNEDGQPVFIEYKIVYRPLGCVVKKTCSAVR